MKISLVIESDTVAEFIAALESVRARPVDVGPLAAAAVIRELEATPKPKPEDKPQPTEPDEPRPAAVVAEAPLQGAEVQEAPLQGAEVQEAPKEAKKGRGRPRKEITEQPPAKTAAPAQVNGGVEDMRANLMKVFAGYVQKYGTNFGYGDVSKLLQDNFGPDVRKSSDVTDDNLVKAVLVVQGAIDANPYGRKVAGAQ